jgi:hypothetical protein
VIGFSSAEDLMDLMDLVDLAEGLWLVLAFVVNLAIVSGSISSIRSIGRLGLKYSKKEYGGMVVVAERGAKLIIQ